MTFNPTAANKERMDAWLGSLAQATDRAAHSAELTRYLATLAKFWTYSAHNVMLIALQMPEATRVAGRKKWESMGRRVKKDQYRRAIQILCPHFGKDGDTGEQVLRYFSTGYVYDGLSRRRRASRCPSVPGRPRTESASSHCATGWWSSPAPAAWPSPSTRCHPACSASPRASARS